MKKTGAYGDAKGDTSFRRTFTLDDYEAQQDEEHQQQQQAKKFDDDAVLEVSQVRPDELDFDSVINQRRIVQTTVRSVGFTCKLCVRVFKDNISFLEHLTSKDHLIKSGVDPTRKATLEEVKEKFQDLRERKRKEDEMKRLSSTELFEQKLQESAETRRQMKLEQKLKKKMERSQGEEEAEEEADAEMMAMMEPPTKGKVVLKTSLGDIEIELWPKQAPKATRNFLQHCLDGYYNECIFHRVIHKFIAQTGDRFGDGGRVAFDESFEVETHSRLRFSHRGLIAMAADDEEHKNKSQFFITLDRTPELEGQHSIFGKVVGDTIFNVLKLNEIEIGHDDRPLYPPKILHVDILNNPFDDMIARRDYSSINKATEKEETEKERRIRLARERQSVRNTTLLSFDNDDSSATTVIRTRPQLKRKDLPVETKPEVESETESEEDDQKKSQLLEIERLKKDLKLLDQKSKPIVKKPIIEVDQEVKRSRLEEEREGFLKHYSDKVIIGGRGSRKSKSSGEEQVLKKLSSFKSKLKSIKPKAHNDKNTNKDLCRLHNVPKCESCRDARQTEADDFQTEPDDWLAHNLKFEKDFRGKNLLDPNTRRMDNVEDLIVIDPLERQTNIMNK